MQTKLYSVVTSVRTVDFTWVSKSINIHKSIYKTLLSFVLLMNTNDYGIEDEM